MLDSLSKHKIFDGLSNFKASLQLGLFKTVDIASLVFFRIAFGLLMVWDLWRYYDLGWIKTLYIEPTYHFTYWGFSWVTPWPGDLMYLHFIVMVILAFFIALGFLYRLSAALFFLGFTYVFLLDEAMYLNHFYLICLISFLMIFIPANRALSIDAWINPGLRSDTVPAWALWLLRAQIGIVYFYGGLTKLNGDWLHGYPMTLILTQNGKVLPFISQMLSREWVGLLTSYYGLLVDLFAVPLLLWKRTRPFAFTALLLFNLLNAWLFSIGVFPWLMIAATLLFFPPDWPRFGGRVLPLLNDEKNPKITKLIGTRQRIVMFLIGLYIIVQLLVPLRHYLYPGNVQWTEEGNFFAWTMLSRKKRSKFRFLATDPSSNYTWILDPREHLSFRQIRSMSTRPELILQFSHYIAKKLRKEGYEEVEIRAHVMTSLNGRRPQFLVAPNVNLVAQGRTIWPVDWIMPLLEPPPESLEEALDNIHLLIK